MARSGGARGAVVLTALQEMDGEAAEAFFRETDALALVEAVSETSDPELLDLISRPEIRRAAVAGILGRITEFADPAALAELTGVVRFDLERRGTLLERHAVRFSGASVELLVDHPEDAPRDVVVTTSLLRFVRLISGQRNAALEYLGGKLDLDGDELLALGVGGVFRVPGQQHAVIDPAALDPVAVAGALEGVRTEHLRKVMAGPVRDIVLGEIFRRLPEFLDARRSAKVRLLVGFRLTGAADGTVDRYVVSVDHGRATVTPGAEDGSAGRDATVTCEGHDFLRLATGHLNPVTGVLRGHLKVRGDRARALLLSSIIDIPSAD